MDDPYRFLGHKAKCQGHNGAGIRNILQTLLPVHNSAVIGWIVMKLGMVVSHIKTVNMKLG